MLDSWQSLIDLKMVIKYFMYLKGTLLVVSLSSFGFLILVD